MPSRHTNHLMLPNFWRIAVPTIYMVIIYIMSEIPGKVDTESYGPMLWIPPSIQNALHIPLFGGLAWLWSWALGNWTSNRSLLFVLPVVITSAYGVFDEWHQLNVPGRYFSLTDIAFNITGAFLGVALYRVVSQRKSSR